MKYTKEYLKENKVSVLCQSDSICKKLKELIGNEVQPHSWQYGVVYYLSFDKEYQKWNWDILSMYQVIDGFNFISNYEASKPNRKIIGYKAPFDIESWGIKKGCIVPIESKVASCKGGYVYSDFMLIAPSEIVEQWEAVYEDDKPTFGSFSEIIRHFEGCKVVYDKGDYILVTNACKHSKTGGLIHHHLSIETGWDFTDSFQLELKELGIKF